VTNDMTGVPKDAREVYLNEKGEPIAWCPKEGIGVTDLERGQFYTINKGRLIQLAARAREKNEIGDGPWAVVCVDVDDKTWAPLVDMLMPGHDWDAIRAQGEHPIARGVVPLKLLKDVVENFYPAAKDEFVSDEINTVVFAAGGASVFHPRSIERQTREPAP